MILLIVVLFVVFVDLEAVARELRAAHPGYLLAASALLVAGMIVYAVRWRILLGNKPTLLHTFHASNVGHAGNIIVPGRAGEPTRIVVMGRSQAVSMTEATSSFVVERLFEQVMRLLALGAAVVYGVGVEVTAATVVGGVGLVLLAFAAIAWLVRNQETALARGPALLARLPRLSEAAAHTFLANLLANLAHASAPRRLMLVSLWSLLTWSCFWGFHYLTLLSLGDAFAPSLRPALSLGVLALSPPSAPTQPGLFHVSTVAPLAAVGFDAEALTAYAVILHILEMVWMIGLALWGTLQMGLSPRVLLERKRQEPSEVNS